MSQRLTRRVLLQGALAAGAAALAAACSGSGPAVVRSGSSSATSAASPATGLSGTITVAYPDELGRKPPYVAAAADEVMRRNPRATVNIALRRVPAGDFYRDLMPALMTGSAPDVIHVGGDRLGELTDAGHVAPLDRYLEGWADWRYYPDSVKAAVTRDGRVWAIPYGLDTRFLYVRRDLLARAGMPADWRPENVEGILQAAARVRDAGVPVQPYALYAGPAGDSGTANHGLIPLIWAYGGEVQDAQGRWIGDSPAIRKALGFYQRAFVVERVSPPEVYTLNRPWTVMRERMGNGSLALLFEGGWVYGSWAAADRAGTERNIGYLLHPTENGGPSFTVGGLGTCWFITARSGNRDLAWEFIRTFNQMETVAKLNVEDPHPSARVDAVKVAEFRSERFLVDSTSSLEHARFLPPDPDLGRVIQAMQSATLHVASGESGPEDAARDYAATLRGVLGPDRTISLM